MKASKNGVKVSKQPILISLFTGAGGLDLGLEAAGFKIAGCIEIDKDARATLSKNRPDWQFHKTGNIHQIDPNQLLQDFKLVNVDVDLISAGPPCQPFSKARYWVNGSAPLMKDQRANTIKAFLDVIEAVKPKRFLMENVPGISTFWETKGGKSLNTIEYIERHIKRINKKHGTRYSLKVLPVNAADYGVPQHRMRVFLYASRDGSSIELPSPTHGPDRAKPFCTAWDAIGDLVADTRNPDLRLRGKWADLLPSIPEGHNYLWHTPRGEGLPLFGWRTRFWSFLLKLSKELPSWTIQAKAGPATGPFHWDNRRLSVEECLRLQTFPEGFVVMGAFASQIVQVGNAVPSAIGELFGELMLRPDIPDPKLSLIPSKRKNCPPPGKVSTVPKKYRTLAGEHPDHPGKGLGPRALSR